MDVRLPNGLVLRGVPEGTTKAQIIERLKKNGYDTDFLENPMNPERAYGQVREDIDPETLQEDQDWLRASSVIYKMREGRDFEGSNADLAEYGLDTMGWFNYNLPKMTMDTAQIKKADQSQKEAFLYLMDTYDNVNVSWDGVGRFVKGVAFDPTVWVGLPSFGLGTAASAATKTATKAGFKEILRSSVRGSVVAGVEGAMYGAVDNYQRQSIEVSAGRKDEIDGSQLAMSAGIGAAGGALLNTGIAAISGPIKNLKDKVVDALPVNKGKAKEHPQVDPESLAEEVSLRPEQSTGATENPSPRGPQEGPGTKEVPTSDQLNEDLFQRVTVDDLNIPELGTTIPYERQHLVEAVNNAMGLVKEMRNLNYLQIEDVIEDMRTRRMTQGEFQRFSLGVLKARDLTALEYAKTYEALTKTSNPDEVAKLTARQNEIEANYSKLYALDSALASHAGYTLRQRQEGMKIDPLDDPETFTKDVFKAQQLKQVKKVKAEYDAKINKALDDGDMGEAGRLLALKDHETRAMIEAEYGKDAGWMRKLNELYVSNAFTPRTVFINIVPSLLKTLYRPALDAMVNNPFSRRSLTEMTATYGAMRSSLSMARKAAIASFRYEQSILTRESGRLLEGELALKGQTGAMIRFIPRLLAASDEFLSQMNYQGYIAGRTAGEAFEQATKKGLKGKQRDKFVKDHVKNAIEDSYNKATTRESIQTIMNKGANLGYRGEALANYVKRELQRSPEAIRHGNDKEALDFVRDVLFKREFTGNGMLSSAAKKYEEWINQYPIVRLLGQLFFRTPVRVFEEGFRLTAGLNLITPNFMKDLRGANGHRAQIRAQGEALLSLSIAGSVMMLYTEGKITGDGAYDNWKQQRNRTDSDLPAPYSIILDDGSTWSYRGFDPLATPVKILVNIFERFDKVAMRQSQAEFQDKNALKEASAAIGAITASIAQAIRDANLMAGVDAMVDLGASIANPEESDSSFVKFIGEKLKLLVPNTLHKIAQSNDPTIDDPHTFWQVVESKVLRGATLGQYEGDDVPKSYDALGNVRRISDTGAMWWIFSTETEEERTKGLSEKELKVLRGLDMIHKQTKTVTAIPHTHPMMGDVDLRTQMTSDGKETLYDRWQRYYRESQPEEVLAPIFEAGLPVGTKQVNGALVTNVTSTINQLRTAAFVRLMSEETKVSEQVVQRMLRQAEAKAGMYDFSQ